MKLKNKKTGEIFENAYVRESHYLGNKRPIAVFVIEGGCPPEKVSIDYNSLAELNKEWEDYKESEGILNIEVDDFVGINRVLIDLASEEEAEKAAEKLKAWKRLGEKEFKFTGVENKDRGFVGDLTNLTTLPSISFLSILIYAHVKPQFTSVAEYEELNEDLALLFGGKDE